MRLPIGIQDFTHLREENYVYVDKTMLIQPLLEGGRFFLSRPRRFGKSLLLSTIKAVFQGRKDLFTGLWLEHHHDFVPHPIIRMDFSNINFTTKTLDEGIVDWLRIVALETGYTITSSNARDAFRELILELSKSKKIVVLIDEYDKPITDTLLEPEKRNINQATLKSVYGVLKPMDASLHLVLLTGVSKIGKLSLFSDLNNLQDISLNSSYNTLCGYTKEEIEFAFVGQLEVLRQTMALTQTELMQLITTWYNGYSWDGLTRVYCPFSFLLFLEQKEFKSYWYETATPTFLLELIRAAKLNPLEFDHVVLDSMAVASTNPDKINPTSLMFQTGYLTITKKRPSPLGTIYELAYPNQEVRVAFSSNLVEEYTQQPIGSFAIFMQEALNNLDWEKFFGICNQVFAGVPYEIFPKQESYVHSLMHLMLTSTGYKTQSQVQTSKGRMDTLVTTSSQSIIFEFKTKGTAKAALKQIDTARYADSLLKPVLKVGVVFNLEQKVITGWAVG